MILLPWCGGQCMKLKVLWYQFASPPGVYEMGEGREKEGGPGKFNFNRDSFGVFPVVKSWRLNWRLPNWVCSRYRRCHTLLGPFGSIPEMKLGKCIWIFVASVECCAAQISPLVNTFIGTGGFGYGVGGSPPGAQVPFGAMRLSPDSSLGAAWFFFE